MREAFPDALAASLMPNHPHLLAHVSHLPQAELRFRRLCFGFARRVKIRGLWESRPPAKLVGAGDKLRREVRYVLLNPTRGRLVCDPLSWLWTTHRDVMGAVVDPWVRTARLADAFRWRRQGFERRFHAYISGDPSVRVEGTAVPTPACATRLSAQPLECLAAAACAATRTRTDALTRRTLTRRLFVRLALEQGWTRTSLVASLVSVSPEVVRRIRIAPPPGMAAAALCAGDPRLRSPIDVASWKNRNFEPQRVDVARTSWGFSNLLRRR
jgi:hypothetical protein